MPKIAGIRRCSCPSRRLYCACKKRTTACAVVRRTVSRPLPIVLSSSLVEDHGLDLGHLLDRVARPLAADPAALEAAVRLEVRAPERRPVDVHVPRLGLAGEPQ